MPNTNASFSPLTRSQRLQTQIDKLEAIGKRGGGSAELTTFDDETEDLLVGLYGTTDQRVEAYNYARLADAGPIVNLPEGAQEPSAEDLPKLAIQQRRQVLEGCLAELSAAESQEASALTGEDHEDPPLLS